MCIYSIYTIYNKSENEHRFNDQKISSYLYSNLLGIQFIEHSQQLVSILQSSYDNLNLGFLQVLSLTNDDLFITKDR